MSLVCSSAVRRSCTTRLAARRPTPRRRAIGEQLASRRDAAHDSLSRQPCDAASRRRPASRRLTTPASGRASTSTSATRSPSRCSAIRRRSSSCRTRSRSDSPDCSRAKSTCSSTARRSPAAERCCAASTSGPIYLYDGQAFLAPKSLNVAKAASLDGATVCVQQGTTTELNLTDFARRNNIKFRPVVIEDLRGAVARARRAVGATSSARTAPVSPRRAQCCAILTTTSSCPTASPRSRSRRSSAMATTSGWSSSTGCSAFPCRPRSSGSRRRTSRRSSRAPIHPLGASSVSSPASPTASASTRAGPAHVIAKVGNYGEIFDRNLGPKTPLGMTRGLNALWTDGGLMYAPPFR